MTAPYPVVSGGAEKPGDRRATGTYYRGQELSNIPVKESRTGEENAIKNGFLVIKSSRPRVHSSLSLAPSPFQVKRWGAGRSARNPSSKIASSSSRSSLPRNGLPLRQGGEPPSHLSGEPPVNLVSDRLYMSDGHLSEWGRVVRPDAPSISTRNRGRGRM